MRCTCPVWCNFLLVTIITSLFYVSSPPSSSCTFLSPSIFFLYFYFFLVPLRSSSCLTLHLSLTSTRLSTFLTSSYHSFHLLFHISAPFVSDLFLSCSLCSLSLRKPARARHLTHLQLCNSPASLHLPSPASSCTL